MCQKCLQHKPDNLSSILQQKGKVSSWKFSSDLYIHVSYAHTKIMNNSLTYQIDIVQHKDTMKLFFMRTKNKQKNNDITQEKLFLAV